MRLDTLRFIQRFRPKSTTSSYASNVRGYDAFLAENAMEALAATPEAITACMRDRLARGQAQSTIARRRVRYLRFPQIRCGEPSS